VRRELEVKGLVIGAMDLLIAAHALALDATLVSNNVAHFSRVPGLKVENWLSK
jgi:tRNA(fMet)-specific endonuclease VapC